MGGKGSKPKTTNKGTTINHEKFGKGIRREAKDPEEPSETIEFMEFQLPVQSDLQYNAWLSNLNKIRDNETEEVLLLPLTQKYEKTGMCGSKGHVQAQYDGYFYVLREQISNRKKLNRLFLQTQLWYLCYNMIRAGNKIHRQKKKIGDLRPQNILINQNGQIKILSTYSLPGEQDSFHMAMENPNLITYLAPEEFESIRNSHHSPGFDYSKAEIFAIGLTVLEAGLLSNSSELYKRSGSEFSIDLGLLNSQIGKFSSLYQSFLTETLISMLKVNIHERRSIEQLYGLLVPYEEQILYLQPFYENPNAVRSGNSQIVHHQPIQSGYYQQSGHSSYGNPTYQSGYQSGFGR